jgi:hypothetical protein
VANNFALSLARESGSAAEREELRAAVLQCREDSYNRIRALLAKAREYIDAGRINEIALNERRMLGQAYNYLYYQRLDRMFASCHRALWGIAENDGNVDLLLRLFRLASFLWRLQGEAKQEVYYMKALKTRMETIEVAADEGEKLYYAKRVRALSQ